jgi:hypothetical protein
MLPSGLRGTLGSFSGGASKWGETFAIGDGGRTVEQADASGINADRRIDRLIALNDGAGFTGDFPHLRLSREFRGLMRGAGGVVGGLSFVADLLGGIIGTPLRGLFHGGADAGAIDEAAHASEGGHQGACQRDMGEAKRHAA